MPAMRAILIPYLAFVTAAGPALCCCLAPPPIKSLAGCTEDCGTAAAKNCRGPSDGCCPKSPAKAPTCPCKDQPNGCCLLTPSIIVTDDSAGRLIVPPAGFDVLTISTPAIQSSCAALAVR